MGSLPSETLAETSFPLKIPLTKMAGVKIKSILAEERQMLLKERITLITCVI